MKYSVQRALIYMQHTLYKSCITWQFNIASAMVYADIACIYSSTPITCQVTLTSFCMQVDVIKSQVVCYSKLAVKSFKLWSTLGRTA